MLRGIDDKKKLLGFFAAKGQRNLVLRVADLRELPMASQAELAGVLRTWGGLGRQESERDVLQFFHYHARNGYIAVPFEKLLICDMQVLERVQQILYEYIDVRRGKGEPSRSSPCTSCGGGGCRVCGGHGTITTFCEMADEEVDLSRMEIAL